MAREVQTVLESRSKRSVRRQQTAAAAAALTLHALLVTAAFALPRLADHSKKYPEYVDVRVVPAAALGLERPRPRPATPKPAPKPAPQPPPKPEPKPDVPALPEPSHKKPAPKPEPATPATRARSSRYSANT